jgi:hypothetical protein
MHGAATGQGVEARSVGRAPNGKVPGPPGRHPGPPSAPVPGCDGAALPPGPPPARPRPGTALSGVSHRGRHLLLGRPRPGSDGFFRFELGCLRPGDAQAPAHFPPRLVGPEEQPGARTGGRQGPPGAQPRSEAGGRDLPGDRAGRHGSPAFSARRGAHPGRPWRATTAQDQQHGRPKVPGALPAHDRQSIVKSLDSVLFLEGLGPRLLTRSARQFPDSDRAVGGADAAVAVDPLQKAQ